MNIVFLALSDNQGLFVQRSDQAVPGISGKNQQSPKESRLRAVVLPLWMRGPAGCCRLDTAAGQIK